jgi:hypothetical protein
MRIVDIREATKPIKSNIRNAYIDFSKMTLSLVAVITDVVRDGKPVEGYGFNSNGRYGQGSLIRERFRPRVLEAKPETLLDETGDNLDPAKIWACMMTNEKPGGHGEDRRQASLPTSRRKVRKRNGQPESLRLCCRGLLLSGKRLGSSEARDAAIHRAGLHGSKAEDRRCLPERGYKPH